MVESTLGTFPRFHAERSLMSRHPVCRLASPFAANASSVKPIQPKFANAAAVPEHLSSHASAGMGRIVSLEEGKGMALDDVVSKVKELLGMKYGMFTCLCVHFKSLMIFQPVTSSPTRTTSTKQPCPFQDQLNRHLRRFRRQPLQGPHRRLLLHRRDEPRAFPLPPLHSHHAHSFINAARDPRIDATREISHRVQSHEH